MPVSVTLPALGESVTEGTVTRWLKQVGDEVAADEPLLEVSTDKVDTEIPSPVSGTLLEIKVAEDETVEVGAELAIIGSGDEQPGTDDGDTEPEAEPEAAAESEPAAQDTGPAEEDPEPAPEVDAPTPQPIAEAAPSGDGDSVTVSLPALGESVTEGTVTRWLKQVGDEVKADEPLLEVSTDKVDTEVPSPVSGTLLEIKVAEDETVEVGAALAVIGSGSPAAAPAPEAPEAPAAAPAPEAPAAAPAPASPAAPSAAPAPAPESAPEPEPTPQAAAQPSAAPSPDSAPAPAPAAPAPAASAPAAEPTHDDGASYVTPLVRKLAAQHHVDLASVTGTGVGGRIRKQDILAAAEAAKAAAAAKAEADAKAAARAAAPAPAAAPAVAASAAATAGTPSPLRGTTEKMSRLRRTIASRMVASLQTSAQLTTVVEVDVTRIARLRNRVKNDFAAREGVKLSFLPFFALAVVEALKSHPTLNSQINSETDEVTYFDTENLAIAVDTEKGLIVPVIKGAGDLNIAGLAKRIADLAARTRSNKIGPDELSGGTFTLTNTGSRGALFDTPIINQPQVAILGTGAVVKRPVVIDDADLGETIAVRHMVYLALTYDHRIVDGSDAARFLVDVKARLEEGSFEGELG
jgi:pyruvate dehydrogenase E2 component (dihydrolipoamide acetyltransferase)